MEVIFTIRSHVIQAKREPIPYYSLRFATIEICVHVFFLSRQDPRVVDYNNIQNACESRRKLPNVVNYFEIPDMKIHSYTCENK